MVGWTGLVAMFRNERWKWPGYETQGELTIDQKHYETSEDMG